MDHMFKRGLSLLMCFCMLFGMLPVSPVHAEELEGAAEEIYFAEPEYVIEDTYVPETEAAAEPAYEEEEFVFEIEVEDEYIPETEPVYEEYIPETEPVYEEVITPETEETVIEEVIEEETVEEALDEHSEGVCEVAVNNEQELLDAIAEHRNCAEVLVIIEDFTTIDDTIEIPENFTLRVEHIINVWGELTLNGPVFVAEGGILDARAGGVLRVRGELTNYGTVGAVEDNSKIIMLGKMNNFGYYEEFNVQYWEDHDCTWNVTQVDEDTHRYTCTICSGGYTEPHSFENNVCTSCGYVGEAEHEHVNVWGPGQVIYQGWHIYTCQTCGADTWEEHDFVDGVCSVCGCMDHEHDFVWRDYLHFEDSGHNMVCDICGMEDFFDHVNVLADWEQDDADDWHILYCEICGMETWEEHDYVDGICSVCDKQEIMEHTHVWIVADAFEGEHWLACDVCGDWELFDHEWDENNVCTVCGYADHDHQMVWHDGGDLEHGGHHLRCDFCGEGTWYSHEFENGICRVCAFVEHEENFTWHDGGEVNGWNHLLVCDCGETSWFGHDFADGDTCIVCGYQLHDHDYVYVEGNGTTVWKHRVTCAICGERGWWYGHDRWDDHDFSDGICVVCGYVCEHEQKFAWRDGGNYTHEEHALSCEICGVEQWGEHTYENGACNVCDLFEHDPVYTVMAGSGDQNYHDVHCFCGWVGSFSHEFDENGVCECGIVGEAPALVVGEISNEFPGEYVAVIPEGHDIVYFNFTPAESGEYIITSTADADTYGYLYENGNEIASDDDGGNGNNFLLEVELNAGTAYQVGIRFYTGGAGSIPFTVDKGHEHDYVLAEGEYICYEYHYEVCTFCERVTSFGHTFEDGFCAVCGYADHDHQMVWHDGGDLTHYQHYLRCDFCGEGSFYSHEFENGICQVCAFVEHEENYTWHDGGEVNGWSHMLNCDCDMTVWADHDFADGDTCIVCGYQLHDHDYAYVEGNDTTVWEHQVTCTICGEHGWWDDHDFSDGICVVCGYEEHTVHDYAWNENNSIYEDSHDLSCTICGSGLGANHEWDENETCIVCGYQVHEHEYALSEEQSWGEHLTVCRICGNTRWVGHTFEDHICTVCGYEEHYPHEFEIYDWNNDGHWAYCTGCGFNGHVPHELDENNVCIGCGNEIHVHNYTREEWYGINDEQHEASCPECGQGNWVDHSFDENNTCTFCGYTAHEHNYVRAEGLYTCYEFHNEVCTFCERVTDFGHTFEDGFCAVCGYADHDHQMVLHDGGDPTHYEHCLRCDFCDEENYYSHEFENGICQVCAFVEHEENYTWHDGGEVNGWDHLLVCECGVTSWSGHDFADGDTCIVCGYQLHDHDYAYVEGNGTIYWAHQVTCTICGEHGGWDDHDFSDGICVVCGYQLHDHIYVYVEGNETNLCNHQTNCEICGTDSWERHSFVNGVCSACGVEEHEHNYVTSWTSVNNHNLTCTVCDDVIGGRHEFTDHVCTICGYEEHYPHSGVTPSGSSEHWVDCEECGFWGSQAHEFVDGFCTGCGYEECKHERVPYDQLTHTTHRAICQKCHTTFVPDEHTPDENGVCSFCGFKVHEMVRTLSDVPYYDDIHFVDCAVCEEGSAARRSYESHTLNDDGVCEFCGYYVHEHSFAPMSIQDEDPYNGYNDANHTMKCEFCNVRIRASHSFTNGRCNDCGYAQHQHLFVWVPGTPFVGNIMHYLTCFYCHIQQYDSHRFGEDGICYTCGYKIEHEFVWTPGNYTNATSHRLACRECNGMAYIDEEHIDNGSGICTVCEQPVHVHSYVYSVPGVVFDSSAVDKHIVRCTVCSELTTTVEYEDHTFDADGICTACGAEQHVHVFGGYSTDPQRHIRTCAVCGISIVGYHTIDPNTHVCAVCAYEPDHEHEYDFITAASDPANLHMGQCRICGTWSDVMPHVFEDCSIPATTTSEGVEGRLVCACGFVRSAGTKVPKLPEVTSGECGENATWTLVDGVLTISGTGAMYDYTPVNNPWANVSAKITSVVIEDGITHVSGYGFYEFRSLESVTMADSVTTIGSQCFRNCSGLTSVKLSKNLAALPMECFVNCSSLKEITIPDGVTSLGASCFSGCMGLTSITLPASVSECAGAFRFAPLTSIYVDADSPYFTVVDGVVFSKDMTTLVAMPEAIGITSYTIPYGVTTLARNCMSYTELKEVTIPDTVTTIGESSFIHSTLESIVIPASVTSIDRSAFGGIHLKKVTFLGDAPNIVCPNFHGATATVEYNPNRSGWDALVGDNFDGVEFGMPISGGNLTWVALEILPEIENVFPKEYIAEVTVPDQEVMFRFTPEESGFYTFESSAELSTSGFVYYEDGTMKNWDNGTNGADGNFKVISELEAGTTYLIGVRYLIYDEESIGTIPFTVYQGAHIAATDRQEKDITWSLTDEGVLTISGSGWHGSYEFPTYWDYATPWITEVVIMPGITRIGSGAFANCYNLTGVSIPDGVTYIGEGAFVHCTSLESLTIPASVTGLGGGFTGCTSLNTIVFEGSAPMICWEDGNEWFTWDGWNLFTDVTATIYYPGMDDSWQNVAGQNYGGNLTWVAKYQMSEAERALREAIANGSSYYVLTEEFILSADLDLNGCVLVLDEGSRLTIPKDVTLTNGRTEISLKGGYLEVFGELVGTRKPEIHMNHYVGLDSTAATNLPISALSFWFYPESEEELRSAAQYITDNGVTHTIMVYSDFEITSDMTVPMIDLFANVRIAEGVTVDMMVCFVGWNGTLDVDGTLNVKMATDVYGVLDLRDGELTGDGTLTVYEGGEVWESDCEVSFSTEEELRAAIKAHKNCVNVTLTKSVYGEIDITSDLDVPVNMTLVIENGPFVVEEGVAMNVYGDLMLVSPAIVWLDGTLTYHGNLTITDNPMGVIASGYENFISPKMSAEEKALRTWSWSGGESGMESYMLDHEVVLTEDFGVRVQGLYIVEGGSLVVPEGITLTGIGENIFLKGGTLTVNGSFASHAMSPRPTKVTSYVNFYEKDAYITNLNAAYVIEMAEASTEEELARAIAAAEGRDNLITMVSGDLHITKDIEIPANTLNVVGKLTVDEGARLTVNSPMNVVHPGASVTVNGKLFLNSTLTNRGTVDVTNGRLINQGEIANNGTILGEENIRLTDLLETPVLISVANATTGVTVKWNAVEGAEAYRVFYKTSTGDWTKAGDTFGTGMTVTGLTSGTQYTFTVSCVSADGSELTSEYNATGLSITYVAVPVISSVANAVNGVTVKWNAVEGAESYRVFYKDGSSWKTAANTTDTSATITGLTSGAKYTFTVRCTSADGKNFTSSFDSTGKSITYVAAPVISSVTNAVNGVTVKWDAVGGANNYRVFYKDGSSWKTVANTTSTSATITGLTSGTKYTFTVRCLSDDGKSFISSYDSTGKSITYVAAPVVTSVANSATGVTVKWDAVGGANNYRVFYKTETSWKTVANTTGTSATITGLTSGMEYTFTVRCLSDDGKSFISSFDSTGKSITYIAAPVISSVANAVNGVTVKWDAVGGASNYRVFYKIDSGSWTTAVNTTSTSATVTGLASGTKYTFTVRCLSADGKSFISSYDNTGKSITYVAAPVISSVANSATGVTVKWDAVPGSSNYRVFYKTETSWKTAANTTATSATITGLTSGTEYTFTVRCLSADGQSFISSYDSTGKSILYVAAPAITSVANGTTGVTVKWGAVSGAENYRVYYKSGSGSWIGVGNTASTSMTVTGLKSGTEYTFTVRCLTADGKTFTSSYDSTGKSITYIATPTLVSVAKSGTNGVAVKWDAVPGAENYRVYYKYGTGSWIGAGNTAGTSMTVTGLKAGTKYTFTVRCFTADGKTAVSSYNSTGLSITR